jgi:hypothetical protein
MREIGKLFPHQRPPLLAGPAPHLRARWAGPGVVYPHFGRRAFAQRLLLTLPGGALSDMGTGGEIIDHVKARNRSEWHLPPVSCKASRGRSVRLTLLFSSRDYGEHALGQEWDCC